MSKVSNSLLGLLALTAMAGCSKYKPAQTSDLSELTAYFSSEGIVSDSIGADSTELLITNFAGPEIVPSPSCLAVASTGEVFVGVDMIGSLGKTPGKGSIVKLVDSDHDGTLDSHTEFVKVDNPRGIIALDDQVYVLHTTFGADSLATGMDLVVFEDKNKDGVADGPAKPLITGISTANQLRSRGTDHSTNGIRMGIDGWIYIAVGDFGFVDAEDREGTKLTMLGGGIVRVRPDGTGMEVYTHGTRNIYDVAIDPFMNIYTRGNTNDGGGWNIRFIHHLQSGEYGYPSLFKHFTDEILPALADLGGGSGTGAYFMDDARWPAQYNRVPMMADWGKSQLYIHRVAMDGPSFTQQDENFIKLSQITDVDVDGSGTMYLAAWDGAGFRGNPEKGYVVRVVPVGWKHEAYPDLKAASVAELAELLKATNSVTRLDAQQELLTRSKDEAAAAALAVAKDNTLPLEARVAAIFTYSQAACGAGVEELVKLGEEDKLREFALRALTDQKACISGVPVDLFIAAAQDANPRVRAAAIVGLGRLGDKKAAEVLLDVPVPASAQIPAKDTEGPHATPNSDIVLPHLAVRALVELNAVDAAVEALDSDNYKLALWALRNMHDPKAVDGLMAAYAASEDAVKKAEIQTALGRLYQKEAPYDGSWWWGTRPDTHGPYYKAENWEASDKIKTFLVAESSASGDSQKAFYAGLNDRHRLGIVELGTESAAPVVEETTVDLESIKNKKGQVGAASIEDVILAVGGLKGDPVIGKTLFTSQGCIACHAIEAGQVMKGPFMGQIGSIMNRDQIVEAILKPNASISQGFASVQITTNDGKFYMGFVTAESAQELTIRDITGTATKLEKKNIKERKELENSMMPAGLANSLSYEELASLVTFLSQQK
ncbi:HEAT repeat domain-containing protein [Algoriphagus sp. H41]|uniref:HEAT repeat domain-containing protein n=1 Tax=Algoriphagus oliviformis TaxID=2811231 RepID=A0ABS3C118_9BACT|nr:HEAT repeat domain-containing protein [Algoriphagus oliviformis]MBN7810617.1 HEAT repeat domain-containing protein [Algoriphagus oliviformis]